jgi:hypothetical protein
MFSDFGLNASVIRSARGDDPVFLQTAWTVQILRGVMLWLISVMLAGRSRPSTKSRSWHSFCLSRA